MESLYHILYGISSCIVVLCLVDFVLFIPSFMSLRVQFSVSVMSSVDIS